MQNPSSRNSSTHSSIYPSSSLIKFLTPMSPFLVEPAVPGTSCHQASHFVIPLVLDFSFLSVFRLINCPASQVMAYSRYVSFRSFCRKSTHFPSQMLWSYPPFDSAPLFKPQTRFVCRIIIFQNKKVDYLWAKRTKLPSWSVVVCWVTSSSILYDRLFVLENLIYRSGNNQTCMIEGVPLPNTAVVPHFFFIFWGKRKILEISYVCFFDDDSAQGRRGEVIFTNGEQHFAVPNRRSLMPLPQSISSHREYTVTFLPGRQIWGNGDEWNSEVPWGDGWFWPKTLHSFFPISKDSAATDALARRRLQNVT